jgi:hypothetical protein
MNLLGFEQETPLSVWRISISLLTFLSQIHQYKTEVERSVIRKKDVWKIHILHRYVRNSSLLLSGRVGYFIHSV